MVFFVMEKNNLRNGIIRILFANILNMLFSIGTNFLLPKYLSVESYSQIKTYQLYITYVAVFHLGYNDGMYLKYGGKTTDSLDIDDLQTDLSTLRIFQFFMMMVSVVTAILIKDYALTMASIALLPMNMNAYFKNLYQAVGEFKSYSKVMNFTTGLTFFINAVLVGIVKTDQSIFYLIGYVVLYSIIWVTLEINLCKIFGVEFVFKRFSWQRMKENITGGFLLLMGNFSSLLFTSIDRWFVKGLLGVAAFAKYSFSVSMENFLNVAVTPISVVMYNYFCTHTKTKEIRKIQELIMAFASIVVMTAFPIKFILKFFLTEYINAEKVIFILFASQILLIMIKTIYVNLYKARKQQKIYFIKLCVIVITTVIFNVLMWGIYKQKETFAMGTLLSVVVWFILCQFDFRDIPLKRKDYIFFVVEILAFISCGYFLGPIVGFLVYALITATMIFICIPNVYKQVWKMMSSAIHILNNRKNFN